MKELGQILQRIEGLATQGKPAALCTVVSTSGSTYRRPGARLLITQSESVGAVSAGCLEDEVIALARRVMQSGQPQLTRFDTTEEMDAIVGTGLGCRGMIEVLLEPLALASPGMKIYRRLHQALFNDQTCILALELTSAKHVLYVGQELCVDEMKNPKLLDAIHVVLRSQSGKRTAILEFDRGTKIYLERVEPPMKLVIFGAGYDALPLVRFATELGLRVTVVDHRPTYVTRERFPMADQLVLAQPQELSGKVPLDERTYIVIMTHSYLHDREILAFALKSDAPYIGQIGPRERTQELLTEIEKEMGSLSAERLARLHAPIGLDLGAETPEEIALSILSEILAIQNERAAGFLKERRSSIHAHDPK